MVMVRMLSVGEHEGETSGKIAGLQGGWFHINVISALKKRSWRLRMFCRSREGMHGTAQRDLFFSFSAWLLWYPLR